MMLCSVCRENIIFDVSPGDDVVSWIPSKGPRSLERNNIIFDVLFEEDVVRRSSPNASSKM
eukprot:568285-Prorocentrum_lima.AAC.1